MCWMQIKWNTKKKKNECPNRPKKITVLVSATAEKCLAVFGVIGWNRCQSSKVKTNQCQIEKQASEATKYICRWVKN